MCGIFALLNNGALQSNSSELVKQFMVGKDRGPETSILEHSIDFKFTIGFHRLAINGLSKEANQPMHYDDYILLCNGEIYNHKSLHSLMGIPNKSSSDCEIIIHLYRKYGIQQTLQMIDGVFAFLLFDLKKNCLFIARDMFGVRPLFLLEGITRKNATKKTHYTFAFASELKLLTNLKMQRTLHIQPCKPGHYSTYNFTKQIPSPYRIDTDMWAWMQPHPYSEKPFATINTPINYSLHSEQDIFSTIRNALIQAVQKRIHTTDRKIACLLSGGLDSSLITALVNKYGIQEPDELETYSIGLEGSEDLKYAKKVADFLGTKHTEIVCSEKDFLDAIPQVIKAIESYDTTTVRASVGNYLVSKYISEHSKAKVIFNGDGSDEICGGYLYFQYAPDAIEFDKECRRLLKDIHLFDVLRSDRSISSNGLEARTPFLDRHFVQTYLSIPPSFRFQKQKCEKYLLRKAFESSQLLPKEVLFRRKEAFSDGVSSQQKSWYQIIQQHVSNLQFPDWLSVRKPRVRDSDDYPVRDDKHNIPQTLEQKYYRYLFEKNYSGCGIIIPYFWMPNFVDATDSSARTLKNYNKKI